MSADENIADECDVSAAPAETQTKPAKDRKNRKEKVKPLAKVMFIVLYLYGMQLYCYIYNQSFNWNEIRAGNRSSSAANYD